MNKKTAIWMMLLVSLSLLATAQDPHFSQFFSSPLTLNPALTGKFDGSVRVVANYRNQWPAFNNVYTTSTLSIDFDILKKKLPENDTWGLGIVMLKDQAGGNILTNTYLGLSTSYHKALDEDGFTKLGIGFQAMYGQKRLDNSKLLFGDQLTPFGFTGLTQDIFNAGNLTINYLDINAGLLYSRSTTESNNFYLGVSAYHINHPKESFKGGGWRVSMRSTLSAGGYFPVSDALTLHTSGIYQLQSRASETTVGGALAASLDTEGDNPTAIYLGSWYRFSDAIIPYLGLEFAGFRIGATYDINISGLKAGSQSRGGMEISLVYVKCPSGYKGIPCPKF